MTPEMRIAIDAHATAILAWTITDYPADPITVADRVTTARLFSESAITKTFANRASSELVDEIDAACRDAETEAAIDAHARTISMLVRG